MTGSKGLNFVVRLFCPNCGNYLTYISVDTLTGDAKPNKVKPLREVDSRKCDGCQEVVAIVGGFGSNT